MWRQELVLLILKVGHLYRCLKYLWYYCNVHVEDKEDFGILWISCNIWLFHLAFNIIIIQGSSVTTVNWDCRKENYKTRSFGCYFCLFMWVRFPSVAFFIHHQRSPLSFFSCIPTTQRPMRLPSTHRIWLPALAVSPKASPYIIYHSAMSWTRDKGTAAH